MMIAWGCPGQQRQGAGWVAKRGGDMQGLHNAPCSAPAMIARNEPQMAFRGLYQLHMPPHEIVRNLTMCARGPPINYFWSMGEAVMTNQHTSQRLGKGQNP